MRGIRWGMLLVAGLTATALCIPCQAVEDAPPDVISASASGSPLLKLSLDDAASFAIANSHTIARQHESAVAARETAASVRVQQYPQLGIGASSTFMSKIGEIAQPGGGTLQIGDHYSWQVGPVLNWVAFDAGQISKRSKSLSHVADAESLSEEAQRRNVLFTSRMSYFSVQLASQQLRLVADALGVARSQYHDVSERASVGSASQLDLVTARQEVSDRETDFQGAQRELAVQVRDLLATLGAEQPKEALAPADVGLARLIGPSAVRPDLLLDLEVPAESIAKMLPRAEGKAEVEEHPSYLSAEQRVRSAAFAYESAQAGHWPKITVTGASTFQYPNFAQLETVQQNTLSLGLSVPVIDWGMISKQARSRRHEMNAAVEQMQETGRELSKELAQTRDRIALLQRSRITTAASARDAVQVARLVYDEYLSGRVIFLEVQRANLQALHAKTEAVRIDAQLLGQLAQMESLITEGAGEQQ